MNKPDAAEWRMTDETNGHKWGLWNHGSSECCRLCGIIRRADDHNGPCKGKVKLRPLFTGQRGPHIPGKD